MYAARTHSALHDLEATTFAEDNVCCWNADIDELHLAVIEWCVCL